MERIKFSMSEIDNATMIETPFGMKLTMFDTPITPGENMRMLFEGKTTMWVPRFSEFGPMVITANPEYKARMEGGEDMFGIPWETAKGSFGTMVRPGNPAVKDINRWEEFVKTPDPDTWDWDNNLKQVKKIADPDRMTDVLFFSGFFERLISFMDFADAAIALIDDDQKPSVHRLFNTLCEIYEKIIIQYKKLGVDVITFHDDWGSQRSPFFGAGTVREMILPYITRIVQVVHDNGMYFDFHSCGKVETLVPLMIEADMDAWSGQDINDYEMLKHKYGDKIIFVDYPRLTIPEGKTVSDLDDKQLLTDAEIFVNGIAKEGGCITAFLTEPVIDKYVYMLSRKAYCS